MPYYSNDCDKCYVAKLEGRDYEWSRKACDKCHYAPYLPKHYLYPGIYNPFFDLPSSESAYPRPRYPRRILTRSYNPYTYNSPRMHQYSRVGFTCGIN